MSHVEVPPLRRPKSDYRPYKKKKKVPTPPVQVHNSLQYALQSAYSHNEALGVLPSHPVVVSKKKKPKERRGENVDAAAGPSTLHLPSVVTTNKKRGRSGRDDNDCEGGRKGKKRSRVEVDLTLSGDEQVHRNVESTPSARTRYKVQTDTLLLYLGLIHPVPVPVLAHNTRFLRNHQAKNHGILPPDNAPANETSSHRYFIPPKLSAQCDEAGDVMSIGGPLSWEEDFHLPVDDDSDGEVEFVEDVSGLNVRPPARVLHNPRPTSRPLPPKIDLAAEMRKKQSRKKPKDRVSATNSPKSTLQSPSAKYAAATSSSSSTGFHAENHQNNRNECQLQHENVSNSMPSAKALGKRKATNSEPPNDSFSSTPAPVNPNSPLILADQPEGLTPSLDVFFHTYTRTPSPDQNPSSSTLVPYSNLQSVSFYPSTGTTAENSAQLVDNFATSNFYQPDLLVNVEHSPERFLSETVLDSLEAHPKQSDPWSALEDEIGGQYAFSTIDPTLLGGQPMNPDPDSPDPEPELEPQLPSLSSEPSSPTSHHSLDLSRDEYEPSTTTTDFVPRTTNLTTSRESSASSASGPLRNAPRRLHSRRKMPDMVAIDDIVSSSSSSSGYESSSSSDVGSESSAAVSSRPRVRTTLSAKPDSQKLPPIPSRPQVWPLEENELYCHQCRTKTRILKMHCSCGKMFCARCITNRYAVLFFFSFFFSLFALIRTWTYSFCLHRYPPGRFDYTQKQDNNCPHCQQFCNCTSCCSKRGETYVSTARPGPKKTVATQPRGLRERVSLGGKTNLPPPSQLPTEPVKYWGAVYSLTGKKITSTFAPETQEDLPAAVFGLLNSEEGVAKPKRQLQPKRVFVGVLQGHWGYSKHRRIKELVDKSYAPPKKLTNKKKHYSGETRLYVGHRARLFWPRKESEYSFLLDDLSPLSSLEDDEDDEPDEIEPPHAEGEFFFWLLFSLDFNAEFLFRETKSSVSWRRCCRSSNCTRFRGLRDGLEGFPGFGLRTCRFSLNLYYFRNSCHIKRSSILVS